MQNPITKIQELYYSLRYCDECGGRQKNCEHYWNGWVKGRSFRNAEIIGWIERNRTVTEVEAGINVVRDHFTSNDLINVIKYDKFYD